MKVTHEPDAQVGNAPATTEVPIVQQATTDGIDAQLLSELDELRQLRKLGLDASTAALLRSLGVC